MEDPTPKAVGSREHRDTWKYAKKSISCRKKEKFFSSFPELLPAFRSCFEPTIQGETNQPSPHAYLIFIHLKGREDLDPTRQGVTNTHIPI